MTQGRFESLYSRGGRFDERQFWAEDRQDGHTFKCSGDHKTRESCPFHDLRADGCFQPDSCGAGVGATTNIPAEQLMARPRGGKPFATSVQRMHNMVGCGGTLMPVDAAGAMDAQKKAKTDARPWTSTRKMTNLFSRAPYLTVPDALKLVAPVEPPFRTNKNVTDCQTNFAHVPDDYGKRVTQERPAFRLKAGKVPFRLDPRLKFEPGSCVEKEKPKKARRVIPRSVYENNKRSIQGTFGKYPAYVPTPYEEPKLKTSSGTLFTYHTHSKRTMPVACTWVEAGLQTAEPKRPRPHSAAV